MSETGRIAAVEGTRVIVLKNCLDSEACFGCLNAECKTRSKTIVAENAGNIPLEPGCLVEIETGTFPTFVQSLAAFGLPALGFAAGFLLTRFLLPAAGEGARAAAGAALMFAAAGAYYLFRRKYPAKITSRVTRCVN